MHILGAIAEFERARIAERVKAGLKRARAHGTRLGRPRASVPVERVQAVSHVSVAAGARLLGVSRSTLKRWRRVVHQSSPTATGYTRAI
jgi:DNA invertase Pin-like site-specific DNA recombinase